MNELFAGVDLGTSGCRLIIINSQKKIVSESSVHYEQPDNQSPHLWWSALCELITNLEDSIKQNLEAISIDGTSGSILLVDERGKPSSSTIMYNDLRATDEALEIKRILAEDNGGQGASGSLARLLWLLKNEPSSEHTHAVHQADYILGRLANNYRFSDENNCLKLGYDSLSREWPKEELSRLGVEESLLPEVYPAGTNVATIDKNQASSLGLPTGLKLISGTTDSIAAFIASGANHVGDAVTSLGSTLVLKLISDKPLFSSKHGIYSHRLNDHWLVGGASNTGAKVLMHYFSQNQLNEMTPQLTPDLPVDLGYYPLANTGERFPVADPQKKPTLTPRPESDIDFFQGILEGISDVEFQGYQKLIKLGAPNVLTIRSVGGGSYNKQWTRIRKNKLNVEMISPEQTEAAYGSALLALKGAYS